MQNQSEISFTSQSVPRGSTATISPSTDTSENNISAPSVDFQNFLQLLTAQLRNQDPLSPQDSTQFVAQLASFSTVEQLVNANSRLDNIAASIVTDSIDRYAGWIDKTAEISGGDAYYNGNDIQFRIAEHPAASRVVAVITDASGQEVTKLSVPNSTAIQLWNGDVDGVRVGYGQYNISARYYDGDQLLSAGPANIFSVIGAVRLTSNGVEIRTSDGISFSPEQIVGFSKSE